MKYPLLKGIKVKLTKNEEVNALLIQLMRASNYDIVTFTYDRHSCLARVFRSNSFDNVVIWNLRHRKARREKGSKLFLSHCKSLDDCLDLLDNLSHPLRIL
jgi:hypothetical protein